METASSSDSIDLTQTATITAVLTDAVAEVAPRVTIAAETIGCGLEQCVRDNVFSCRSNPDPTRREAKEILKAAQTTLQTSVEQLAKGTVDVATFEEATESKTLFEGSAECFKRYRTLMKMVWQMQ